MPCYILEVAQTDKNNEIIYELSTNSIKGVTDHLSDYDTFARTISTELYDILQENLSHNNTQESRDSQKREINIPFKFTVKAIL